MASDIKVKIETLDHPISEQAMVHAADMLTKDLNGVLIKSLDHRCDLNITFVDCILHEGRMPRLGQGIKPQSNKISLEVQHEKPDGYFYEGVFIPFNETNQPKIVKKPKDIWQTQFIKQETGELADSSYRQLTIASTIGSYVHTNSYAISEDESKFNPRKRKAVGQRKAESQGGSSAKKNKIVQAYQQTIQDIEKEVTQSQDSPHYGVIHLLLKQPIGRYTHHTIGFYGCGDFFSFIDVTNKEGHRFFKKLSEGVLLQEFKEFAYVFYKTKSAIYLQENTDLPATTLPQSNQSSGISSDSLLSSLGSTPPPTLNQNSSSSHPISSSSFSSSSSSSELDQTPVQSRTPETKLKLSNPNEAQANYESGMRYYSGANSTSKNPEKAIPFFKLAAEHNHAKAQYMLGEYYYHEEEDKEKALKWYRLAAERNLPEAQFRVGMYHYYRAPEIDYEEAFRLFQLSANQGYIWGQHRLAICYHRGDGVKENWPEAIRLYQLVVDQGGKPSFTAKFFLSTLWYELGMRHHKGEMVIQNDEEAVKCFKKSAELGRSAAQIMLGRCYVTGKGVAQDTKEAVRCYRLAAEQGNMEAQFELGDCYRVGLGVKQDSKESFRLYALAAKQGHAEAQAQIGFCYSLGIGVEKDFKEAVRYYQLAAAQGNAVAQMNLGFRYENGVAVERDHKEAVRYYQLAAAQGNVVAQMNLGFRYENGVAVERDLKQAEHFYRLSAAQGNQQAKDALERLLKTKYGHYSPRLIGKEQQQGKLTSHPEQPTSSPKGP